MPESNDQSSYLAWSKTVEDVKFRAFAFTEGCGEPDCPYCEQLSALGPIWTFFQAPNEGHDEWTLCMLAAGDLLDALEGDEAMILAVINDVVFASDRSRTYWSKAAALIGMPWTTIREHPYAVAVKHKAALDEMTHDDSLVHTLVEHATVEELRGLRDAQRDPDGRRFGAAFGRLWWEMVKRIARKNRG